MWRDHPISFCADHVGAIIQFHFVLITLARSVFSVFGFRRVLAVT